MKIKFQKIEIESMCTPGNPGLFLATGTYKLSAFGNTKRNAIKNLKMGLKKIKV